MGEKPTAADEQVTGAQERGVAQVGLGVASQRMAGEAGGGVEGSGEGWIKMDPALGAAPEPIEGGGEERVKWVVGPDATRVPVPGGDPGQAGALRPGDPIPDIDVTYDPNKPN